ncbi:MULTISPECIES: hypothetical protein [unclassified Bradyrhizobium]|uniref:hypothetical protein n=1 Tax=unclassified Bradyrhizobium TaxID=2631580 RepID=UPI002916E185|nr:MULTISPECIES: hypothetical protein [unclassified Bradyrhizobium]
MVLTLKSSRVAEVYIVELEANGDKRIARATQMNNNPKQWSAQIEHPAGVRPCSNIYGTRGDVAVALAEYLNRTRSSYLQQAGRGHRPEQRVRDANVRVDEFGQPMEVTNFQTRSR